MCGQTNMFPGMCAHDIMAECASTTSLRRDPGLDLTLVAGPWDARIVERVSVIDDTARIAAARRGELVVLTRRASRSASGRGLIQLLEAAGEHELAALALYGRATTSQAVIAAASGARVALLAIGIGEDPAALAFALEATLRADADAVLRRLTAAVAAIEHAEPDGTEAILVAASAALDAEVSFRDGVVSADRNDTAIRIGCRLVADAVARVASHPEPPVGGGGGNVILVEPAGRDGGDLVVLEALRLAREAGWHANAKARALACRVTETAAVVAARLIERLPVSVVCGVGGDGSEARAALRSGAGGAHHGRAASLRRRRPRRTGATNSPGRRPLDRRRPASSRRSSSWEGRRRRPRSRPCGCTSTAGDRWLGVARSCTCTRTPSPTG